jgi:predicted nucleic acid-binding protein
VIVADVNLLCYLLIRGEHTETAERVYARDRRWIARRYHRFELLNVLSNNVRFAGMPREHALAVWNRALRIVPGFAVEPEPVDVFNASADLKLTTYDCEYVVLARMRKLRLVTADRQVLQAVPDLAVSIEDFADGK